MEGGEIGEIGEIGNNNFLFLPFTKQRLQIFPKIIHKNKKKKMHQKNKPENHLKYSHPNLKQEYVLEIQKKKIPSKNSIPHQKLPLSTSPLFPFANPNREQHSNSFQTATFHHNPGTGFSLSTVSAGANFSITANPARANNANNANRVVNANVADNAVNANVANSVINANEASNSFGDMVYSSGASAMVDQCTHIANGRNQNLRQQELDVNSTNVRSALASSANNRSFFASHANQSFDVNHSRDYSLFPNPPANDAKERRGSTGEWSSANDRTALSHANGRNDISDGEKYLMQEKFADDITQGRYNPIKISDNIQQKDAFTFYRPSTTDYFARGDSPISLISPLSPFPPLSSLSSGAPLSPLSPTAPLSLIPPVSPNSSPSHYSPSFVSPLPPLFSNTPVSPLSPLPPLSSLSPQVLSSSSIDWRGTATSYPQGRGNSTSVHANDRMETQFQPGQERGETPHRAPSRIQINREQFPESQPTYIYPANNATDSVSVSPLSPCLHCANYRPTSPLYATASRSHYAVSPGTRRGPNFPANEFGVLPPARHGPIDYGVSYHHHASSQGTYLPTANVRSPVFSSRGHEERKEEVVRDSTPVIRFRVPQRKKKQVNASSFFLFQKCFPTKRATKSISLSSLSSPPLLSSPCASPPVYPTESTNSYQWSHLYYEV